MKFLTALILFFITNSYCEMKFNPSFNLSISGGKYYLDDRSSSLDLNLDAILSPVLSFDENRSLYPTYIGYYRGVQDIEELVGGDVLVRQRMGHSFSLKYVYLKDFNYIKPRFSYSINYINETKDENWGEGLFDYRTLSFGIEFEQERPNASYKEYFDFFSVDYPNYSTLLSKADTVIDTTTYSELSQNAGKDVLNSRNYRAGISYTIFPKNLTLTSSLNFTYKDYFDQALVNESGGFDSDKRRDLLTEAGLNLEKSDKKLYMGVSFYFNWLKSNQNSYDASRTKYIEDYYSYLSFDITPKITINLKNKGSFSYFFSYNRLNYLGRLSQDINGDYLSSKIYQNFYINSLAVKYEVSKNLYANASYSYQVVDSNMRYEAGYRYNYKSSNFMFGISWEF
ncbi:MAG: hypothetical protein K6357_06445 [Elusimicrobiota bacterium]